MNPTQQIDISKKTNQVPRHEYLTFPRKKLSANTLIDKTKEILTMSMINKMLYIYSPFIIHKIINQAK